MPKMGIDHKNIVTVSVCHTAKSLSLRDGQCGFYIRDVDISIQQESLPYDYSASLMFKAAE